MQMFSADAPRLLLAFADDVDTIERSSIKVKEQFIKLEKEIKKWVLRSME